MKILFFIIVIAGGAFLVIFGGMDDSPGAQALGLIVVITGIAGLIKRIRKTYKS